ncbi:MAG: tRNA 2-selenouridine(34) synthase MnmH [Burkholderiales bacterium]|nr:tRNA 2-selenouridine(34) synthase MnmH [Burkholderiales bacterium]
MKAPENMRRMQTGMQALPLTLSQLTVFDAIIDVRSPGEFAIDHIPGAVNHPVLSDSERVQVGTIYKQVSAFAAKKVGAAIVARNIGAHIDTSFRDKPKSWKPLIYCWRGGARSGAMAHILRSIGWTCLQLEGGYKNWRGQVIRDLENLPAKFRYHVICGRTGSGKSRLLDALTENGAQVLDLERLAAHKGSVLGDLPGEPQPAQKFFETRIWAALSGFDPSRPVYVEAESKKVGNLRIPQPLVAEMWRGSCFEVITPALLRATLLKEEYAHLIDNRELLFYKLDCLKALHPGSQIDTWKRLALDARWNEFVADMLANHYDPAYERSMFTNYVNAREAMTLRTTDISQNSFVALSASLPR